MRLKHKGQCLTLGGCEAPSRQTAGLPSAKREGQALPGGAGQGPVLVANLSGDLTRSIRDE